MILQVKMNPYMNIWLILSTYFNVESNHFTPFFISMFYEMATFHKAQSILSVVQWQDNGESRISYLMCDSDAGGK